jgi:hypothetical protein
MNTITSLMEMSFSWFVIQWLACVVLHVEMGHCQVDGILYNVHRYFFQRDCPTVALMFLAPPSGGKERGLTDDEPIRLIDVEARDFDLFLSILYPA